MAPIGSASSDRVGVHRMTNHIWCARPRCNERISVPRRKPSRHPKKHRTFSVINPATGDSLAMYPIATQAEVRAKVERAREAFRSWSKLDAEDRATYLLHYAEVHRKLKADNARALTREMGRN